MSYTFLWEGNADETRYYITMAIWEVRRKYYAIFMRGTICKVLEMWLYCNSRQILPLLKEVFGSTTMPLFVGLIPTSDKMQINIDINLLPTFITCHFSMLIKDTSQEPSYEYDTYFCVHMITTFCYIFIFTYKIKGNHTLHNRIVNILHFSWLRLFWISPWAVAIPYIYPT